MESPNLAKASPSNQKLIKKVNEYIKKRSTPASSRSTIDQGALQSEYNQQTMRRKNITNKKNKRNFTVQKNGAITDDNKTNEDNGVDEALISILYPGNEKPIHNKKKVIIEETTEEYVERKNRERMNYKIRRKDAAKLCERLSKPKPTFQSPNTEFYDGLIPFPQNDTIQTNFTPKKAKKQQNKNFEHVCSFVQFHLDECDEVLTFHELQSELTFFKIIDNSINEKPMIEKKLLPLCVADMSEQDEEEDYTEQKYSRDKIAQVLKNAVRGNYKGKFWSHVSNSIRYVFMNSKISIFTYKDDKKTNEKQMTSSKDDNIHNSYQSEESETTNDNEKSSDKSAKSNDNLDQKFENENIEFNNNKSFDEQKNDNIHNENLESENIDSNNNNLNNQDFDNTDEKINDQINNNSDDNIDNQSHDNSNIRNPNLLNETNEINNDNQNSDNSNVSNQNPQIENNESNNNNIDSQSSDEENNNNNDNSNHPNNDNSNINNQNLQSESNEINSENLDNQNLDNENINNNNDNNNSDIQNIDNDQNFDNVNNDNNGVQNFDNRNIEVNDNELNNNNDIQESSLIEHEAIGSQNEFENNSINKENPENDTKSNDELLKITLSNDKNNELNTSTHDTSFDLKQLSVDSQDTDHFSNEQLSSYDESDEVVANNSINNNQIETDKEQIDSQNTSNFQSQSESYDNDEAYTSIPEPNSKPKKKKVVPIIKKDDSNYPRLYDELNFMKTPPPKPKPKEKDSFHRYRDATLKNAALPKSPGYS